MTGVGTMIAGRYRLDAVIGRGGMSTVYKAFDTVLERPVAIKLMHREIATDSDQLERFRREARSVAQLNHPHVVSVIDAGEEPSPDGEIPPLGAPYIVLEYVDGETLKGLIRRNGPLEIPQAIAYSIEIARALGAAHERRIVHRDVKPQNILIDPEGGAKITDFGIARSLSEEGLTLAGRVLGTTDYVSPEQALGQPVTPQSDLYSLGIVLYEMLTGDVPFHGDSPVAVAMKHVREEIPDVQARRPELSAATAAVVDRAVAKNLDERYPDAASMASDLEEVLAVEASRTGQATGEVTTVLQTLPGRIRSRLPWRMRHPARWIASLALLGAIVALVLLIAAADRTHRGTGVSPGATSKAGLVPVQLSQDAAHGYNPFGTGPENRDQVGNLVDSDPSTTWTTETYYDGTLKKSNGVGLGVYLDAAPGVIARAMEIQTPTPGFAAAVYVADHLQSPLSYSSESLAARGWQGPVGASAKVHDGERIALQRKGRRHRYYLLWITALPPGKQSATISDLTLFK